MSASRENNRSEEKSGTPRSTRGLRPLSFDSFGFATAKTPYRIKIERVDNPSSNETKPTEFKIKNPRKRETSNKLASLLTPSDSKLATIFRPKSSNTSPSSRKPAGTESAPKKLVLRLNRDKSLTFPQSTKAERAESFGFTERLCQTPKFSRQAFKPQFEKSSSVVKAFGANTNEGIVRNYNEDKVSIVLEITKPANLSGEEWPKCSFFGVYDGHGGAACADFLRDNLYRYITKEPAFPSNPKEALKKGFQAAEQKYLEICEALPGSKFERSGSCALVVLIVDDMCYVANVGDSRAVMSAENGNRVLELSRDHKPAEESERKRIIQNGGRVYQNEMDSNLSALECKILGLNEISLPYRVFPGRLSVSRTIGDPYAKLPQHGGNPRVVIPDPEISAFRISPNHDFIIIGCDGIFDKLSSKECIETVWKGVKARSIKSTTQEKCSAGVDALLNEAMERQSLDNVTAVMISFSELNGHTKASQESKIENYYETFKPIETELFGFTTRITRNASNEGLFKEKSIKARSINRKGSVTFKHSYYSNDLAKNQLVEILPPTSRERTAK